MIKFITVYFSSLRTVFQVENFKPSGSPLYPPVSGDKNNNRGALHQNKRSFLLDKNNGNAGVDFDSDDYNGFCDNEKLDSDPEYRFFNHLSLRKNKSGETVSNSSEWNHNNSRDQLCYDWLTKSHERHETKKANMDDIDAAKQLSISAAASHEATDSDQSTVEWVESDLEMDINEDQKDGTKLKDGFPDVFALDVTCHSVTVTFLESPSKCGFFVTDE